jgi:hypothetical protein
MGLKDIDQSLPVVFILNSKIGSVRIENMIDDEGYVFTPCSGQHFGKFSIQSCIRKSSHSSKVFSVAFKSSDSVTLCWPVEAYDSGPVRFKNAVSEYEKLVGDKMPLIYSTFPMIGSDGIKFPMLVHSSSFRPNEKRDGVTLTDNKYTDDTTKESIELDLNNKMLFEDAVDVYEKFVEAVAGDAENLYYITKINGIPESDWINKNWYKKEISEPLADIVANTPIIDVSEKKEDRKSILDEKGEIQIFFPSISIGDPDEDRMRLNETFYDFCCNIFEKKIPIRKDLEHWHKILWKDDLVIKILEIEDLLDEISNEHGSINLLCEKLQLDNSGVMEWLNKLYKLLSETKNNGLLNEYAVIPNQKGDFRLASELKTEDPESMIDPNIICILRNLDPDEDWFEILVHRGVNECKYSIEQYSLKENASNKINELLLQPKDYNDLLSKKSTQRMLQRLLSFVFETETSNNIKKQIFNHSQDVFGKITERSIPFFKDFKIDNTIKHMIRLINNKIEETENIKGLMHLLNKDKDATIIWLNGFLNIQIKKDFEGLIHWANVVPNQYETFCAHGEEGDKVKMYRPYELTDAYAHNFLSDQLIKNLLFFDPSQDWKSFLLLDGVQLKTLPPKTRFELGAAIDKCIIEISRDILTDNEEKKAVYRNDLLELLEWWESHRLSWADYFKSLPLHADKLYSLISFSKDFVDILKNKERFDLAKKINKSKLSVDTIEKTLDKIEEMQDKLGVGVVEEFLRKAETFMEKKEVFNERLQIGENIEELLRAALALEDLDIIPDKSASGSFDIGVFHKSNPSRVLKLEVKSFMYGSEAPFNFSPGQIVESASDSSNYIVCTLQRPQNGATSIEYLKSNLSIQNNLVSLTTDFFDRIETFNIIYQESKTGKIPLEIPCVTDPRVRIDHNKLLKNTGGYDALIQTIKDKFK